MDRQFADVQRQVKEDAQLHGRVQLLSISFDPSYDTPPVLLAHAKALKADPSMWTFLTGSSTDVERFAGRFGVAVMRDTPTEVVHNLRTGVIDGHGRLVKILNGIQWQPSELVAELRTAVGR
jgi:protein SCO1/2